MNNKRRVFLYAFDRQAKVVNFRWTCGDDITIRHIHFLAKQMYLIAGKDQIIVYAVDDYPRLYQDYKDSLKDNNPETQYAFYDIIERNGIYIHP